MLKMLHCIHGRLLVLIVISAILFIAGRKVAFIAYTAVTAQAAETMDDVYTHPQTQGSWSHPFICKSLRVTADYSKLKLEWNAFFSLKLGGALDLYPIASWEFFPAAWGECDSSGRSPILRI